MLIQGNGMLSKSLSISCGPEHGKININVYRTIYLLVPANNLDVTSAVPQKELENNLDLGKVCSLLNL